MSKLNKVAILFFIAVIIITIFSWYLLGLDCKDASCLFDKKLSLYAPLYYGGRWLVLVTFALLFISPGIFKKWLLYIASPVLLLSIFLVGSISVYSDGIIKMSRSDMAELCMQGLAIVTIVFLLVQKYLQRKS